MRIPVRAARDTTVAAAGVIILCLVLLAAMTAERRAASTDRQVVAGISAQLSAYGLKYGDWSGADQALARLAGAVDRRIRLTTVTGTPVVDTDVLAGREPRPITGPAVPIDSRPRLHLVADQEAEAPAVTALEIREFRRGAALAACLGKAGIPVDVVRRPSGVPRLQAVAAAPPAELMRVSKQCPQAITSTEDLAADTAAIYGCIDAGTTSSQALLACLSRVFTERTDTVTADPVLLYVGPGGPGGPGGPLPPVLLAGLALLAVLLLAAGVAPARHRLIGWWRRRPGDPEAARGREDLQRQRVATVAHELRSPLSNMRAYLEALSDGVILPEPKLFASLHEEALMQQRIIDDLAHDLLAPFGEAVYDRVTFDLADLAESAWLAHRPGADAAGIRLTVVTDGPLPVDGDPGRLRQVVANMLSNAVRYTAAGGSVEIRCRRAGGQAALEVRDTGIGIGADELGRVFERHWRSRAAGDIAPSGSGLGLSIARQIVVDHGGTITVDSRPGRGATFTVLLPLTGNEAASLSRREARR